MVRIRKGFMFRSFIITVLFFSACLFYGMPQYLSGLGEDCRDDCWISFLKHPTAFLLDISLSRTPSLAFKKAWEEKNLMKGKYYDALYQLFLINTACESWDGSNGNMMYSIKAAFFSFHCEGFDKTLTEEEHSDFEKLAGKFFAKYYKFHPEELEENLE